ncbi:MAG TPA: cytochrome c biogenesis protein CcdA [Candidatus Acidoferrales bacterium]|jgi:thiol:disulfide interchange protein|nr:cytochrome c biogenesis protein CcdA [Candidatus Acidoferrales bacterium]
MRRAGGRAIAFFLLLGTSAWAQKDQHAVWTLSVEPASVAPGGKALLKMAGHIDEGWHVYSASSPGAIPTKIQLAPNAAVGEYRLLQPPPKRAFDPSLNSDTETYEAEVAFLLEVAVKADAPAGLVELALSARYQTCNPKMCVPSKWSGTATFTVDPAAKTAAPVIPAGYAEPVVPASGPVSAASGPVGPARSDGLGGFLVVAFGFGLASIFTPCVFPMIPITMSYFLNRPTGGRRESVMQALVFCLGIIVLFSGLGLAASAILGPAGVKQLGANRWVNGFISALFIAFGLSLLGAFEITIPSSILTRLNQSADRGGYAGSLLMGLTFSLSSFACVGPFVGTLLAGSMAGSVAGSAPGSVSGAATRPLFGMLTFATGLALPFFLLALFPSYLKRMPRSGGWLARVKVVMGFVILAASLYYLARLDQVLQLGFLTRERFLAAWIVLFAMAGLYLLGFLRMEGIKSDEPLGLGRLLTGIAFLIFAISLVPGMSGSKLGDLDAYVPMASGDASGSPAQSGPVWMKDQYREALDRARREGKLVFVDFTGYACTNCHWMRANMLSKPEIVAVLKDFVLVELYTDGTDAASEANQKLQLEKFGTIAEPFYVILDPDEKLIAKYEGQTTDVAEYLAFLKKGAGGQGPGAGGQAATGGDLPHVTSITGQPVDIAALQGKVVVVNFWATWCVPCIQEIPSFNKLHKELGLKGLVVLGVSMDEEGITRVQPFLKKHPMDYTVALGTEAISTQYGLGDSLPVTLIFDRSGKQVKRFEGFTSEADLQAAVQKAL